MCVYAHVQIHGRKRWMPDVLVSLNLPSQDLFSALLCPPLCFRRLTLSGYPTFVIWLPLDSDNRKHQWKIRKLSRERHRAFFPGFGAFFSGSCLWLCSWSPCWKAALQGSSSYQTVIHYLHLLSSGPGRDASFSLSLFSDFESLFVRHSKTIHYSLYI